MAYCGVKFSMLIVALMVSEVITGDHYHPSFKSGGKSSSNRVHRSTNVDDEQDMEYWLEEGENNLRSSLDIVTKAVNEHAKNVIIFVGDGMSIPTVTAARIYKAQKNGNTDTPETESLIFETLDHLGHSKTYAIDKQVVDSASSATAMFTGVKTKYGTLGFDSHIERGYPETMDESIEVTSILTLAQEVGMGTGIVTTARLTHATPAGMYAHAFDRNWECDTEYSDLVEDDSEASADNPPEGYSDIAHQLINNSPGNQAKVIMGGGYPSFFPASMEEELENELGTYTDDFDCFRSDGTDLTEQWLQEKGDTAKFVMTYDDLEAVNVEETDYIFGLFGKSHVEYDHNRQEGRDPTLAQMVEKAIGILEKESNGFLLLVEGGRIDHAHHDVLAHTALDETIALDLAVETSMNMLAENGKLDETLIIVTADHAHTMTISGYPHRGNDIIGLSNEFYDDEPEPLPYTTLSYANGKSFYDQNLPNPDNPDQITRLDLTDVDVTDWTFEYTSAGPLYSETHGGDDVAIFASGPGAFLFHTSHEQTHIFQVMAYSLCIGDYLGYSSDDSVCQIRVEGKEDNGSSSVQPQTLTVATFILILFKQFMC